MKFCRLDNKEYFKSSLPLLWTSWSLTTHQMACSYRQSTSESHAYLKHLIIARRENKSGEETTELSTYLHVLFGEACGLAKTDYLVGCKSTAAQASLLPTTRNNRVKSNPGPASDIAGTDALWAIDLMA